MDKIIKVVSAILIGIPGCFIIIIFPSLINFKEYPVYINILNIFILIIGILMVLIGSNKWKKWIYLFPIASIPITMLIIHFLGHNLNIDCFRSKEKMLLYPGLVSIILLKIIMIKDSKKR